VRSGKLILQAKCVVCPSVGAFDCVTHPEIRLHRKLYGDGREHPTPDPKLGSLESGSDEDETTASATGPPLTVMRPAEARLVTSELGLAISDHLVQTYLQVFQTQCTVVDWEAFSHNWDAAGRNSDALNPTNECLALVIQVCLFLDRTYNGSKLTLNTTGLGRALLRQSSRPRPRRREDSSDASGSATAPRTRFHRDWEPAREVCASDDRPCAAEDRSKGGLQEGERRVLFLLPSA
jgi:hypothetical protein